MHYIPQVYVFDGYYNYLFLQISIHPSSSAYPGPGHGGSSLSRSHEKHEIILQSSCFLKVIACER